MPFEKVIDPGSSFDVSGIIGQSKDFLGKLLSFLIKSLREGLKLTK